MDEHRRAATVMRLKALVSAILAKDGLRQPPGWHVELLPDGTLTVHDPASADGNPHGRIRAGLRIDNALKRPEEALAQLMATQARAALRRMHTMPELRKAERTFAYAVGWSALAHPLAVAMAQFEGFPSRHLPPTRRAPGGISKDYPQPRRPVTLETTVTWDMLSMNLTTRMQSGGQDITAHLESKPGLTTLLVGMRIPDTMQSALIKEPLSRLITIPVEDERLRGAVEGLRIARIEAKTAKAIVGIPAVDGTLITIASTAWIPWGPPPDDVARLVELSPEVS